MKMWLIGFAAFWATSVIVVVVSALPCLWDKEPANTLVDLSQLDIYDGIKK